VLKTHHHPNLFIAPAIETPRNRVAARKIHGATAIVPDHLRRLKWNELVKTGDFVENEQQEFEPWTGPSGFRADAFVKIIYRNRPHWPAVGRKTS